MKIKSRKELKKEYKLNYGNISDDIYERLKNHLKEENCVISIAEPM